MIEYQSSSLDGIFHALADPTRREMLRRLSSGTHSVGQLAAPFAITLAAASKHIKTLERAGLVRRTVQGRTHLCTLDAAPLADADAWLRAYSRFWTTRLDALETLLRAEDAGTDTGGGTVPPDGTSSSPPPQPPENRNE